jgi:predicted RNA binding protein YcfA (HicA-like mRNA interferase family)
VGYRGVKSVSGKDFARVLVRHGWELRRINGSHHVFTKIGNPARISLPVHGGDTLKIGLLRHLMKVAGIDENEF